MVVVDADDCWHSVASVANVDVDVGATMINQFVVVVPCVVPVVIVAGVSTGNDALASSSPDGLATMDVLGNEDVELIPVSVKGDVATMLANECRGVLVASGVVTGLTSVPANAKSRRIRFVDGEVDAAASTSAVTARLGSVWFSSAAV
jgi:hypothetical protein